MLFTSEEIKRENMKQLLKDVSDALEDRGYKWVKSEPFSIADCWIFRFQNKLENPPKYLQRISDDFKFSDER